MKLIAQKPCSFGGKKFYIGDEIPAEIVLDPEAQVKMGVLAIAGANGPAPIRKINVETMAVHVPAEEGNMELQLTQEGLQAVVTVLTGKPADAEAVINQMNDGDALILLHMADGRKAVKAAAEARGKAISQESAGEQ